MTGHMRSTVDPVSKEQGSSQGLPSKESQSTTTPSQPPLRLPAWMFRARPFQHPSRSAKHRPLIRALGTICEVAARVVKPPELSPRENTARCYETLFDPLCADTGVWPDYTEGYYPQGDEEYEQAKEMEIDYIVELCRLRPGLKVIDLGCGNGRILQRVVDEGCDAVGVTICRTQMETCQARGLDVRLCSFDQVQEVFDAESFDVVILSGPTEHFVSEEDVRTGQMEAIQDGLFEDLRYLLKPGGRVFVSCIHLREPASVHKMSANPFDHEIESFNFFCSILVRIYSGWYPHGDDYRRSANKFGLTCTFERDATWDYLITSFHWGRRLKHFVKNNRRFMVRYLTRFFFQDPRYFYIAFLFFYYDAWTWQFRGGEKSPMLEKWFLFERLKDS